MQWKFEQLFSIQVLHERYLLDPPNDPATASVDYSLVPTPATFNRMRRLNWVVKPMPAGIMVFAEFIVKKDGTSIPRGEPLQDEGFSFFMRLHSPSLLQATKPYMVKNGQTVTPNASLPAYSGHSRLLYFDNRAPVTSSDGTLHLTAGEFADVTEFASRAPSPFNYTASQADSTQVEATALLPGNSAVQTFSLNPQTRTARLDLIENAYRLVQKPSNKAEIVCLTSEEVAGNTLGLIRIFNTSQLPWNQSRRYRVVWAKV